MCPFGFPTNFAGDLKKLSNNGQMAGACDVKPRHTEAFISRTPNKTKRPFKPVEMPQPVTLDHTARKVQGVNRMAPNRNKGVNRIPPGKDGKVGTGTDSRTNVVEQNPGHDLPPLFNRNSGED